MSKPTKVPRTEQWKTNTANRRARLRQEGGGPFFAMLDGEYARKVKKLLARRKAAWLKNHGRAITKTDLLKLMIDADVAQVNRRQRVTARRNGKAAAQTTGPARLSAGQP